MKKSVIVGTIVFICIIGIAFTLSMLIVDEDVSGERKTKVKEIYSKNSTDVDSAVQEFTSSEEYNKMSKEQ